MKFRAMQCSYRAQEEKPACVVLSEHTQFSGLEDGFLIGDVTQHLLNNYSLFSIEK